MGKDEWAPFLYEDDAPNQAEGAPAPSGEAKISELAEQWIIATEAVKAAKASLEEIEADLARFIPEHVHKVDLGAVVISIDRPETWSWDEEKLEELVEKNPFLDMPSFIKTKISVDRARFEAQPAAVRDTFAPALTRKQGKPRIKIKRI